MVSAESFFFSFIILFKGLEYMCVCVCVCVIEVDDAINV